MSQQSVVAEAVASGGRAVRLLHDPDIYFPYRLVLAHKNHPSDPSWARNLRLALQGANWRLVVQNTAVDGTDAYYYMEWAYIGEGADWPPERVLAPLFKALFLHGLSVPPIPEATGQQSKLFMDSGTSYTTSAMTIPPVMYITASF